ncbi:TGF-beta domain-containing family member maverick [Halictus rubicundus]|uniref:TGF-beta domain-containing family member maverick n=1 Tax=Halictus rubicundus TaxID=77578 RepID=UPI004036C118
MGKLATTGGRRVTRDNEEDQAASACPCGPSSASSGRAFVAEPVRGIAPRGDALPTIVFDPDQGERVRECRSWIFAGARTPEDPTHGSLGPGRDLSSLHEPTRPPLETAATTVPSLHRPHATHQPIRVGDPCGTVFRESRERVQTTRPHLETATGTYPSLHGFHANRRNTHHRLIRDDDPRSTVSRVSEERVPMSRDSNDGAPVSRNSNEYRVPVIGAVQTTRPLLETATTYPSSLETATRTYPSPHGFHSNRNAHHRLIRDDDPQYAVSRDSKNRVSVSRDCKKRVPVIRRVPTTRPTRSLVAIAILAMCTLAAAVPTPKPNQVDPLRTGLRRDLDGSSGLEDVYEDAFEDVFREEDRTNAGTVLDENELEIIRRSIARGLGLKRIPDPAKANVSQAEYERAHREYLKKVHLSFDEEASKSRRSLHVFHAAAHPGNGSSRIDRGQRRHRLFFPVEIPEADANVSVDHATLRLLLHGDYSERSELDVQLYLNTFGSRRLIVRKRVPGGDSRWLELDSTAAVSSWLETGLENFGLELEFLQDDEPVRRSFSSPVLNVFTESSESNALKDGLSRSKRSTPEELMSLHRGRRTKCKGESKKCCRHELTVMFKDLKGFEFIVYPKTFDAGYCKGRCPPRYNPAHHHALLQSLLWKEDRKKVPKPCCAPSKLDQLMIVYFDENDSTQLKVSYWKNIKVLECACS